MGQPKGNQARRTNHPRILNPQSLPLFPCPIYVLGDCRQVSGVKAPLGEV